MANQVRRYGSSIQVRLAYVYQHHHSQCQRHAYIRQRDHHSNEGDDENGIRGKAVAQGEKVAEFTRQNGGIKRVLESSKLKMQLFNNHKRNAKDENGPTGMPTTFAEFEQDGEFERT